MRAVLAAALLLAAPLYAGQVQEGLLFPDNDVGHAVHMASQYSRYPEPFFARPTARLMPASWFRHTICGNDFMPCGVAGVVLWDEPNVIYISDELPVERRMDVLVHEATHWLQFRAGWAGKPHNCADEAAHEAEAYTTQFLYRVLHEHYKGGFWMPDYSCPGDDHTD